MSALPTPMHAPGRPPVHGAIGPESNRLAAAGDGRFGGEPVPNLDQLLAAHLDSLCLLMTRLEQQGQQPPAQGTSSRNDVNLLKTGYQEALTRFANLLTKPAPPQTLTRQPAPAPGAQIRDAEFIAQVQKQAEAELGNCLFGVNELATAMAMTRRHLARRFAELIGRPPSQWLRDLRLNRAEQLLRHGKLNVAQVANQVGFAKPSYFAQQFKRVYGCTPSAFRARALTPANST